MNIENYPFHILYFPSDKAVKHTKGTVTYTYNQGLYVISKKEVNGSFKRYHGTINSAGVIWKTLSSVPILPSFPKTHLVKDDCVESIKGLIAEFFRYVPENTEIEGGRYSSTGETFGLKDIAFPKLIEFFGSDNVHLEGEIAYIYFEKLTVSNGNISHEMHDIYIRVNRMYSLHLMRTSLSDAERAVEYLFSHARKGRWGSFVDLCLGSSDTPISRSCTYFNRLIQNYNFNTKNPYKSNFDLQLSGNCLQQVNVATSNTGITLQMVPEVETQVYLFCNNLLQYLQWESLSGGPYINMSSVTGQNNSSSNEVPNVPQNILDEGFHRLMTTYKDKLIYQVTEETDVTKFNCEFPQDVMLKACEYKFIKAGNRIIIYDPKIKSTDAIKTKVVNASAFLTFNGKNIYPHKVIPGTNVKLDINNAFPPLIFQQHVQQKLNKLIQNVTTSFVKNGHRTSQT